MSSKISVKTLVLCFLLLIGCSKQNDAQKFPSTSSQIKDSDALSSCQQVNLFKDIELNGYFLYHFSKCVANKSRSSIATMTVIEKLGVEGLEDLAQLLKVNPEQRNNGYPLIKALLVFVERGSYNEETKSVDEELAQEMFRDLQLFFQNINPAYAISLALDLNSDGTLIKLLNEMNYLISSLNEDSFIALFRSYLTNPNLAESLVSFNEIIFKNNDNYNALNKIASFETTMSPDLQTRQECLNSWLTPRIQGTDVLSLSIKENVACYQQAQLTMTQQNGFDRYNNFLTSMNKIRTRNTSGSDQLAKFIAQIFNKFLDRDENERLTLLYKLNDSIFKAWNEQASTFKNIISLVGLLDQTKLPEIEPLITTLEQFLKDYPEKASAEMLEKIGAAQVREYVEQKIIKNQSSHLCTQLTHSLIQESGNEQMIKALDELVNPSSKCVHNIPPIVGYIFDFFIDHNLLSKAQIVSSLESYSSELQNSHVGANNKKESELKDFLLQALFDLETELTHDKFTLHWMGLGQGAVPKKIIKKIISEIESIDQLNEIQIAKIDLKLEQDSYVRKYLHAHFLEKFIEKKTNELEYSLESFHNAFNSTSEDKANAVLKGIYPHGPFEEIINSSLYLNSISQKLATNLPQDSFRASGILYRLRTPGIYVHNNRLNIHENTPENTFVGSDDSAFRIRTKKSGAATVIKDFAFSSKPMIMSKRFQELKLQDAIGTTPMFGSGLFLGKDTFEGLDSELITWATALSSSFEDYEVLGNLMQNRTIFDDSYFDRYSKYFTTTKYTTEDLRQITLYYAKNFLYAPGITPENYTINTDTNLDLRFYSLPSIPNQNWNTFKSLYPQSSRLRNKLVSPMELVASMKVARPEQFAAYIADADFQAKITNPEQVTEVINSLPAPSREIFKFYSTFNLLSKAKKIDAYMPMASDGNECVDANMLPIKCSITTGDLNSYLIAHAGSFYCGLKKLDSEFFSSELKLNFSDESFAELCDNTINGFDSFNSVTENVPEYYHLLALKNIVKLGKKPQISKSLKTIASKIALIRLQEKYQHDKKHLVRELLKNSSLLPANINAVVSKYTLDNKGLDFGRPGIVNSFLLHIRKNSIGTLINTHLRAIGTCKNKSFDGVDADEIVKQSASYKFLMDIVIPRFHALKGSNASALEFAFDIAYTVSNYPDRDALFKALTHLVVFPDDIETQFIFTNTINLYLEKLRADNGGDFNWEQKDKFFLKQFIRRENLRAVTHILGSLDIKDVHETLEVVFDSLKNFESKDVMYQTAINLSGLLTSEFVSQYPDQKVTVADVVEDRINLLATNNYTQTLLPHLNHFLTAISTSQKDFENVGQPAISNNIYEMVRYLFSNQEHNLFKMMFIYQDHFATRSSTNSLQLSVSNMLSGFNLNKNKNALKNLDRLLRNPSIGKWRTLYKPLLFGQYQNLISKNLNNFNRLTKTDVRNLSSDMNEILPATYNMLNFVGKRIKWDTNTSEDTKYGLYGIIRIANPDNYVLDKQRELVDLWLKELN